MDADSERLNGATPPKKFGRKKPGDWLKKRTKAPWRQESSPARVVRALLEDYSSFGDADAFNARPGGSADPWRQGGFGPIPDLDLTGAEAAPAGGAVCSTCQGKGVDEVGEPCAHCEGTGSHQDLGDDQDQLNTPGTDPTAALEPGGGPAATPGATPPGVPQPKYGNRMQWRPEESLARRMFR